MINLRRPVELWRRLQGSLWFLPAMLTLAAAVLAVVTLWLDHRVGRSGVMSSPLLFSGWSEGARAVLATIAGSIITVTGVVFSVTIVALQLASSQFTPRVLRSFTEDRANQTVLGVFIGTFTYALLILRGVRSMVDDADRFIPAISVTVAIVLCLVSIGFLIFFINHIATSIRAEVILYRVTEDALKVVERVYPDLRSEPQVARGSNAAVPAPFASTHELRARKSGYLQALDVSTLVRTARDSGLFITMDHKVGDFIIEGDVVAHIRAADRIGSGDSTDIREALDAIRDAVQIGYERTNQQDVSRGLIELTDIGVRALSPGTNDPTTAIVSIDRVTEVLTLLATRQLPDAQAYDEQGTLRFSGKALTFDAVALPPFANLRHYGAGHPEVAIRIIQSLHRLAARLPVEERTGLIAEIVETAAAAARSVSSEIDLRRIQDAASSALAH